MVLTSISNLHPQRITERLVSLLSLGLAICSPKLLVVLLICKL